MTSRQPPSPDIATPEPRNDGTSTAHRHKLAVDHLVVVASSLREGVTWCEQTLGVTPVPGGEHPLMGTHNRLLALSSPAFPAAYLEVIAINTEAAYPLPTRGKRWFDMDNPTLREQLRDNGPQLVHWVARVPDLARTLSEWNLLGLNPGTPTALSRLTPDGPLTWQLTVRSDGRRAMGGCLPTLIHWDTRHPSDSLPPAGLTLQHIRLAHPQSDVLAHALGCDMQGSISIAHATHPHLQATLATRAGTVTLCMPNMPSVITP